MMARDKLNDYRKKRDGRVFFDYLRNAYAQTGVAPVAVPIEWEGIARHAISVDTVTERLPQSAAAWR